MDVAFLHWSGVPILLLVGFAAAISFGIIAIDHLLGPKRPSPTKLAPYECGVPPVGSPRERFHVRYFVIGLLFILFDVEVVFLYLWVYLFREPQARIYGLIELAIFLGVLTLGLAYAWGKGALEWE